MVAIGCTVHWQILIHAGLARHDNAVLENFNTHGIERPSFNEVLVDVICDRHDCNLRHRHVCACCWVIRVKKA